MSLAFGRHAMSIPGPSVIPDRVLQAMHIPAPNIYEGKLVDLTHSLLPDLKKMARTEGDVAIYISNGHGAWEASLANTLEAGDRVLVLYTGRFGRGWAEMAMSLGVDVQSMDFGTALPVDAEAVAETLRADTDHSIKAVLTVHTDTASSVRNDIPALRAAMTEAGHPALLMVDCIASLACEPFEMDDWGVDVMVAGCQKGLMTPPGLGFVFLNEKAKAARNRLTRVSGYWDWVPRIQPNLYYQFFGGTAPTHHLFGLREALTMLLEEEGLEAVWSRHALFARTIWAAIDTWAEGGNLSCNVVDPAHRSIAVTSVQTGEDEAGRLRRWCEDEAGLTLGIGLGLEAPDSHPGDSLFRIGHMGHLSPPMILGTLGTIDAGLKTLGISHGNGAVEAAIRTLSAG